MADRDAEFGLHEMEPSPIDETPSSSKDDYFPSTTSSSSKTTNTLGLSQHSTLWYLSRIQRYSSYAFTAFGVAHITNTSIIPLITQSVPASEPYLLLTRPYYQGFPMEILVAGSFWAHIISGVGMRVYRRNLNARRYGSSSHDKVGLRGFFSGSRFWPVVSGISKLGFIFTPLLLGHIILQRGIPADFPGGSSNINLSYVSHAFAKHPAISFFGFGALISVGVTHMTWGWAKWLGATPDQTTASGEDRALSKKRRWYVVNALAAAVIGLWMAGAFGVVARGGEAHGWLGRLYNEMYQSIPVVGKWL